MAQWDEIAGADSLDEALALCPAGQPDLSEWLAGKLEERGLGRSDVIRAARLNPTFGYQIFMGKRRGSRDKLLRLAFGLRLGIRDASEMLELGGHNSLSPASRRDVIIAWSLYHHETVDGCDDALWSHQEETLA